MEPKDSRMSRETDKGLPDLQEPPRRVGWPLIPTVLFEGYTQLIGWSLLLACLVPLCLVEPSLKTRAHLLLFLGPTETVQGRLVSLTKTKFGRGGGGTGSLHNSSGSTIFKYRFEFDVDERRVAGESYGLEELSEGDEYEIEYSRLSPHTARVAGTQPGIFEYLQATIYLIVGGIGLIILLCSLPWRFKCLGLLRSGMPAFAKLVAQEETNVAVGGESIRNLTFEYLPRNAKTPLTTIIKSTEVMSEGGGIKVLYSPKRPSKLILFREITEAAEITPSGYFSTQKVSQAVGYLCLPGTAMFFFTAWLFRMLSN